MPPKTTLLIFFSLGYRRRWRCCSVSHLVSLNTEQKHPPEPGHPWGAGSHPGTARTAPPSAEPQTATGNDCPAARRTGPAHAAEPRAPRWRASQAPCCCCSGAPRARPCCLGQRQSSEGSLQALPQQRQERGVRCGGACLSSCPFTPYLDISLCWIHEFISKRVLGMVTMKTPVTLSLILLAQISCLVSCIPMQKTQKTNKTNKLEVQSLL